MNPLYRLCVAAAFLISTGCTALASAPAAQCEPRLAHWLDPSNGEAIAPDKLFDRIAGGSVVLLGEVHDRAAHHRWQLYSLAALHSRRADMVVGLEMLPRRTQPTLDDWSADKLDEAAFLKRSEWNAVWGYDPDLYLPLLQFARQQRLPVIALNVDRELVSKVGTGGWDALAESERAGLSDPAPASAEYRRRLGELYAYKMSLRQAADETGQDLEAIMQSEAFAHFVDAQLTWDRAMAEAISAAHRRDPEALVVGIIGRGHLEYGYGVPHQLADLGIDDVIVLLPLDADDGCESLEVGLADAVFVVEARGDGAPPARPLLGVMIEDADDGVRVLEVVSGGVAQAAGVRVGDLIQTAAGFEVGTTAELIEVIGRQAPGTWLPLVVLRDGESRELVARFPQRFD